MATGDNDVCGTVCGAVARWATTLAVSVVPLTSGCASDGDQKPESATDTSDTGGEDGDPGPVDIEVIDLAPTPAAAVAPGASIEGDPLAPLATDGTEVFVATDAGPQRVVETTMVPVEIVTDGTTPVTTGSISQALNLDGSALLVAEEGVFSSAGDRLVYHPISEFMSALDSPRLFGGSRSTDGTLAMWVLSAEGDFRLTDGTVHQWTVPALDASTGLSLAVESDGIALLGQDAHLVELTLEDGAVRDLLSPMGVASFGVRDETSRLYLGGEHGVLVRGPDASYRHYTLGGEAGAPASSVRQLLARPGGGVYVLLDDAVAVLDDSPTADGAPPRLEEVLPLESPATNITTDGYGHLWVVRDGALSVAYTGEPVSFAEAVAPVLGETCNVCHLSEASGAPIIDWTDYDQAVERAQALGSRTKDGSMPPPGTGLELTSIQIATIDRWISTGTLP